MVERPFDIGVFMKGPFDHCDTAIRALAAVDVPSLLDVQLASHLLGVQHFSDQLTVHQARVLAVAEQCLRSPRAASPITVI